MRRKIPQAPTVNTSSNTFYDNKPQYTSEPHLSDETDSPMQHHQMRRGSTRRTTQGNQHTTNAPGKIKNSVNRIYVGREEIVKLYLTTDFLILSIIRRPFAHNDHMWLYNMAYIEKLAESRTQIFSLTCQVLTAIIITTIRKRYGHSAHQIKVCSALPLSEKGYYV